MSNLLEKASIIITPTAYDVGSINAVKPKESPYADLTFTRSTTAQRMKENGYIGEESVNTPRLDFRGDNHWIIEPQATNTATYSNDFTQGSIFVNASASAQNVVLTSAQGISPDGTNNAWKIALSDAADNLHHLRYTNTTVIANNVNVLSVFAKKGSGVDWFGIFADNLDATNRAWFNLSNGTKGTLTNGLNSTIEDYGNGWYRCSLAFSSTTDLQSEHVRIVITNADGASSYAGSTSDHHLIYGLQAESTSTSSYDYPTSYIPTIGSTATRGTEIATDSGNSTMFNDSEGVLYAEIAGFNANGLDRTISISDGTNAEAIRLRLSSTSNRIDCLIRDGNTSVVGVNYTPSDITSFNKIAIKYKSGDTALWVGGSERATSTVTFALNGLSKLALDQGQGSTPFYGKIKCIAIYKEALTDTELQCLTS